MSYDDSLKHEEDYCLKQIRLLQEQCIRDSGPYHDRLMRINSMKRPRLMINVEDLEAIGLNRIITCHHKNMAVGTDGFCDRCRPNPQDHPGPSGPRVHPVVGQTLPEQGQ